MAQMESDAFRDLLKVRKIPLYRYDLEDFDIHLHNLQELGRL